MFKTFLPPLQSLKHGKCVMSFETRHILSMKAVTFRGTMGLLGCGLVELKLTWNETAMKMTINSSCPCKWMLTYWYSDVFIKTVSKLLFKLKHRMFFLELTGIRVPDPSLSERGSCWQRMGHTAHGTAFQKTAQGLAAWNFSAVSVGKNVKTPGWKHSVDLESFPSTRRTPQGAAQFGRSWVDSANQEISANRKSPSVPGCVQHDRAREWRCQEIMEAAAQELLL